MVYRRAWMTIFSGFFEPLFYLFSLGVGLGHFVGQGARRVVRELHRAGAARLAAMNGAVYDATTNVFWKLRYGKVYDSMLATPLGPIDVAIGETAWAQFRGTALRDGLRHHDRRARPHPLVVGPARAAGRDGRRLRLRRHGDRRVDVPAQLAGLRLVQLVLLPMFLFSATFYPLSVYPVAIQWFVRFSPLYHAIALDPLAHARHSRPDQPPERGVPRRRSADRDLVARRRMAGLLLT